VAVFSANQALGGVPDSFLTGVTDLLIASVGGQSVLYAASGPSGGVTAYALTPGGPQLLDHAAFGPGAAAAGPVRLEAVEFGGTPALVALGLRDTALPRFDLTPTGQIQGPARLEAQGGLADPVLAMATATLGGTDFVYTGHFGQTGISVCALGPGGRLIPEGAIGGDPTGPEPDIVALETVELGGRTLLLGLSAQSHALQSYRLDANGMPQPADSAGPAQGLGLTDPTALAVVDLAGVTYAILGAAGSGSISVVQVHRNGGLTPTDHIIDSLDTRFAGVQALDTVTVEGQVFVLAGGADDGLSLFSLMPDGRLLHRAQIADTAATRLANVSALTATVENGRVEIYTAGEAETGIGHLSATLGPLATPLIGTDADDSLVGGAAGDLIAGGDGDDRIQGGAGDDLLQDGAGADRLWGGAGADIFVLAADGHTDRVMDFQLGVDRLDLSAFGRIHDLSQLDIAATANGATIRFGSETVHVITAGGHPLDIVRLDLSDLVDMAHYVTGPLPPPTPPPTPPSPPPPPTPPPPRGPTPGDDQLTGDDGPNRIAGLGGDDILDGLGGDDTLLGQSGHDRLIGGPGDDTLNGDAGNDRLTGGAGADTLRGGTQEDILYGGDGQDRLFGDAGFDILFGQGGADRLEGGGQADNLWGGNGPDLMFGGGGFDRLFGGNGRDTGYGGAGPDALFGHIGQDQLYGQSGDDRLYGGSGDDRLDGGSGDDRLNGGLGFDWLFGGTGNDTLIGSFNADTFVFADFGGGFGQDVIEDFDARSRAEKIDLSRVSTIADYADLVADHMCQQGRDVVIDAGGGNTITLLDVDIARLDPSDFLF